MMVDMQKSACYGLLFLKGGTMEETTDLAEFRKKYLRTGALRAVTGLIAFGGFCYLIAPYAANPFRAIEWFMIPLIGAGYAVSFAKPGRRSGSLLMVIALALVMSRPLEFPTTFWVFLPMFLSAMGSAIAFPYPKKPQTA
jgi:hypothetical protein